MHICHVQSDFLHFNCTCIQLAVPTIIVVIFIYDNQTAYFIFYLKHSHVKFMLSEPFRGTKQAFSFFLFFLSWFHKKLHSESCSTRAQLSGYFCNTQKWLFVPCMHNSYHPKKNTKPTEIFQ